MPPSFPNYLFKLEPEDTTFYLFSPEVPRSIEVPLHLWPLRCFIIHQTTVKTSQYVLLSPFSPFSKQFLKSGFQSSQTHQLVPSSNFKIYLKDLAPFLTSLPSVWGSRASCAMNRIKNKSCPPSIILLVFSMTRRHLGYPHHCPPCAPQEDHLR